MARRFSRRTLLQTAGVGAAASLLPWLRWAPRARAADPSIPKRIVFFYDHGAPRGLWNPVAPAGQASPTETSFDLGPLHQSLVPYKQSLLILDGLDMASSDLDHSATANAHSAGATHSMAAVNRVGPALPGGVSIDQLIAQRLNSPQPVTAVPSLDLALEVSGDPDGASAFGPGELVPRLWDPRDIFRYLFPPTANVSRRQRVADAVQAEFKALNPKLSQNDRMKLDAHLSAVHDLELRLGLGPSAACQKPDSSQIDADSLIFDTGGQSPDAMATTYKAVVDWNIKLAVTALQCDLTRVVKFSFPVIMPDKIIGYQPGAWNTFDSHDLIHKISDPLSAQSQIPEAVQVVKNINLEQAQRFAQLLQLLQSVPESDGQTLLDHTIVVWCGELAEGGHNLRGLPWMLAGGGGGTLRTGRYLKLPRTQDPNFDPPNPQFPNEAYANTKGIPHNNLYVSLANLMGIPITTFGNPVTCTGPLSGLS